MTMAKAAQPGGAKRVGEATFTRFRIAQRIEHLVLMVSFIMLVVTGLSEKYFQSGWAQWIISHLGGFDSTRLIHHVFGFIFVAGAVYHLGFLVYHLFVRRRPPHMLPTVKDARDATTYLRYCLGLTSEQPEYDRYDFRQKFEYWGIIFGGLIMIISGGFIMFPVWVTQFLPGAFVPAAMELHSNEAMLAVLTIVVWHLYSAHLRPGIFPGDPTIFTGKISRERMKEEHLLEYLRLVGETAEDDPADKTDPSESADTA